MKNIAILIAGGVGSRMGEQIPKQFIKVFGKPVLMYTLENFQQHNLIDEIILVCIKGWEDYVSRLAAEQGISKLKKIVPGGNSAQESIYNGVLSLKDECSEDDIIIIHDGIRPLVDDFVLTDVIKVCREHGAAATALPYNEQIFVADDEQSSIKYIPRETLRRVSTPQAYSYKKLFDRYNEAFEKKIGIFGSSYANTMMVELGERLYFSLGSDKNIKLTTPDDLDLFKAYLIKEKNVNI